MIYENNDDIRLITCANSSREIQRQLNACREERRPYVFVTDTMRHIENIRRILVPVSMLEEEVYKAEICTYLARKTGAKIVLLKAKDYGSKAQHNLNKIITHIRSVAERTGENIEFEVHEGVKDSFSINREAAERQRDFGHQLLLLTASREYGLDDWIFGPQERHAIRHSQVPVMLINPRADLFSLCD
ncbi:MAG: universal stress protein [Paludibacteraceae bacterium]|nr:universal stress protein [Paludibacteraceae bacterium]